MGNSLNTKRHNADIPTSIQKGGQPIRGITEDTKFDVKKVLRNLVENSRTKYDLYDEVDEETELGVKNLRGGVHYDEFDYPDFTIEDTDITVQPIKTKNRYSKYEHDILTLLNGGNVVDSDENVKGDTELEKIKNIYDEGCGCAGQQEQILYHKKKINKLDEGCGCVGDQIIYPKINKDIDEGCGCVGDQIIYTGGQRGDPYLVGRHNNKDDNAYEMFAQMIHGGKKKKHKTKDNEKSINLSSTVNQPIDSSSSIGYKTSDNDAKDLNIMPFYSTPDSSTSSIKNAKTPVSTTSTVYSRTSTMSSSLKNYNTSTTSDNYMARPKHKTRY